MPHWLLSGLPEEVKITQDAVQFGYAAIALSSQMRQHPRCWDTSWPPTPGSDFPMVLTTFMYAFIAVCNSCSCIFCHVSSKTHSVSPCQSLSVLTVLSALTSRAVNPPMTFFAFGATMLALGLTACFEWHAWHLHNRNSLMGNLELSGMGCMQ